MTTTLRSNGYTVITAQERYGRKSVDEELLDECGDDGLVLLTNDRDFVELHDGIDHAGLIVYTTPNPSPSEFAVAVDRIERFSPPTSCRISWCGSKTGCERGDAVAARSWRMKGERTE